MPKHAALENDQLVSSELPFLVDTGDERYYRVNGITLNLSDPETGEVCRSVKLAHNQVEPSANGPAILAELPISLRGDQILSLTLHVEQGPCNPQNPTCPPIGDSVASIERPFAIHFVVENKA